MQHNIDSLKYFTVHPLGFITDDFLSMILTHAYNLHGFSIRFSDYEQPWITSNNNSELNLYNMLQYITIESFICLARLPLQKLCIVA